MTVARRCAALILSLSLVSCELLQGAGGAGIPAYAMPELSLGDVTLTAHPTATDLAAWYCPEVFPGPIGGGACSLAIGPRPPEHRMQFHFEIGYLVDNPNSVPIPTTEILAAIEVFPGFEAAELGAVCAVLCPPDAFECTGEPGANSCKADVNDITSFEDLQQRIVEGLIVLAIEAATGNLENYVQREIPAGARNFEIKVRFSLGLHAMIDIMRSLVDQVVTDFKNGQEVAFEIPFTVYGTLWFDVPFLGRAALGYGPFDDVWHLEP